MCSRHTLLSAARKVRRTGPAHTKTRYRGKLPNSFLACGSTRRDPRTSGARSSRHTRSSSSCTLLRTFHRNSRSLDHSRASTSQMHAPPWTIGCRLPRSEHRSLHCRPSNRYHGNTTRRYKLVGSMGKCSPSCHARRPAPCANAHKTIRGARHSQIRQNSRCRGSTTRPIHMSGNLIRTCRLSTVSCIGGAAM